MHMDWREDCGVGFQYPVQSEGRTLQEIDTCLVSRGWDEDPFFVVFFYQGKDIFGQHIDHVEIHKGQEMYDALLKYAEAHHGPDIAQANNAAEAIMKQANIIASAEMREEARRDAAWNVE